MRDMVKVNKRAFPAALVFLLAAVGVPAVAQTQSSGSSSTDDSSAIQSVTTVQQQLSKPGPSAAPTNSIDSSFNGSIVRDKATDGVLQLTLDDAMQRGLRNNLGLVLQTSNEKSAGGQRLQQLQELLPTVRGSASIEVEQINLAAYGLKFPGLNPIIGPFQVVDFRAYLTQKLVDGRSADTARSEQRADRAREEAEAEAKSSELAVSLAPAPV